MGYHFRTPASWYKKVMLLVLAATFMLGGISLAPKQVEAAVNLAYNRPVTVSSVESAAYGGQYAVDANGNTRWASAWSDQQYIIVDLGSVQTVASVRLAWEAAYARGFQIQTSTNNSTWTTVYSNYNGTGGSNMINFNATQARYVKMYAFQRATQYGYSLYEFEIYGSASGGGGTVGVLEYLQSISGNQTVIGIHNREPNSQPSLQTDRVYNITGRYPGLWSGDFLFSQNDVNNRWNMIYEAKRQWDNGAIVNIMMHVTNPKQGEVGSWDGGVVSSLTNAEWNSLITNGGTLNTAWKQRLDTYAVYLQYLKDNGVTVLFRPFHEMNQGIFWWAGRPGSNGTAALYRLTRDYLQNVKGLDNLIWVWNMQDLDLNWSVYNPGNAYWDIFSVDVYNPDGFTTAKYNTALNVAGNKPIAIGECDRLPTASQLLAQPRWVFAMSWAELTFQHNTNAQLQALYGATNVITRDELPAFH
ncbi:glycosyl hydrolase [Paenibacillus daejeonensis]|uniref:glycosyl hydrolase n=1 Tax=Paenibacillus daejeonensis TaxID=135193 RepID=UPI00037737A7|nr:glycosyl hydrolase [Paenibacillus daejeonensis]